VSVPFFKKEKTMAHAGNQIISLGTTLYYHGISRLYVVLFSE